MNDDVTGSAGARFVHAAGWPACLRLAPDLRYAATNAAYDAMMGRCLTGLTLVEAHPELAGQGIFEMHEEVMRTGKPISHEDRMVRLRAPDGTMVPRWFAFTYQPWFEHGQAVGVLVLARETTEAVRTREALEQAIRARDDLSRTVAHDLRTPLNAIAGWMQVLERMPADAQRVQQAARVVLRNVDALVQLLDDLAMSPTRTGPIEIERGPVDFAALVGDAVETIRPRASDAGIHVVVQTDPRCHVHGDDRRLLQVVNNLLSNALKYGAPEHDAAPTRLRVSLALWQGRVRLQVEDEGRGIEPALLGRIFEPYVQGDSSSPGFGLGLSICRGLVEAHGGTLQAHSEGPGRGSTFTVELPWLADGRPERTLPGRPRVLVVEDHDDTRAFMVELLGLCGVEVHSARDGADALAFLEGATVDLVVSDLDMPRIDGLAMVHALTAQGYTLPAIAVTANADGELARQAREAGFLEVLTKPVSLERFQRVLDDLLGR